HCQRVCCTLLLSTSLLLCRYLLLHHPATPQIYTLSLHDALPISRAAASSSRAPWGRGGRRTTPAGSCRARRCRPPCDRTSSTRSDRKSTRLNSSHVKISYAVFCLKKKKKTETRDVVRAEQTRTTL